MSGGYWEYKNDNACGEIFTWDVTPCYNMGSKNYKIYSQVARSMNPLEDFEISDLVFDVFCLLHSFDWYASGDNMPETYQKDVEFFKQKWFKSTRSERLKEYVDSAVSGLRQNLLEMIGKQEAPDAG